MPDTKPLTDNQIAAIWVRYEETGSIRATARELKLAVSTVGKYLAQDPHRLRTLRTAKEEERAAKWEQVEHHTLDALVHGCKHLERIVGKRREHWRAKDRENLHLLARVLSSSRLVADTATKQVQLLTGGVTDRVEAMGAGDRDLVTDAMLVEQALQADYPLPPGLAERFRLAGAADDAAESGRPPTKPVDSRPAKPPAKPRKAPTRVIKSKGRTR